MRQSIGYSDIRRMFLPVPPIEEQKEIAAYLDEKCGKIEKLIAGLQDEIKYVEELRVRIISDVVTGRRLKNS